MKQKNANGKVNSHSPEGASPLHLDLARRIVRMIHEDKVPVGTRLNEKRLAELLGVSRTPVRAALAHLGELGFVAHRLNRGVELIAIPSMPEAPEPDVLQGDALLVQIALDRRNHKFGEQVAEQDLMAAYGLPRAAIKGALARLADLGVVERKLGYRWKFVDTVYDAAAQAEAYQFRLLVEPAGLLNPGFSPAPGWLDDMAAQHRAFLQQKWTQSSSVAFFEMNAAFHEGLAKASGNRYFHDAIGRMNRLRRFNNYDWKHGRDRVGVSCREHLKILEALMAGHVGSAALLLRQHLEVSSRLRHLPPDIPQMY